MNNYCTGECGVCNKNDVMTKEEFKKRWESDEKGGGITNDNIVACSIAWGLYDGHGSLPINAVIALVTQAADTIDQDLWSAFLPQRTDVPDCPDEARHDMITEQDHAGGGEMGLSEASIRAKNEYIKTRYDYVKIRVVKGYRDSVIREAAMREGLSINEYVLSTVAERIMRDYPDIKNVDAWKISQREGE